MASNLLYHGRPTRQLYLIIILKMRKILIPFTVSLVLFLSACSAYKIDIQQGNAFDREDFAALRVGMNQRQVTFLLGTPLIKDPFHPDRWDYVYTFQPGGKPMVKQHLTLWFEGEKLVKIDDSAVAKETLPSRSPNKLRHDSGAGGGGGHGH